MYVTGDKASRETFERAAEGHAPLAYAVSYKIGDGELGNGVLETSSATVRLLSAEGSEVMSAPLGGISDLAFPRLRSGRVEFVAAGVRCQVNIGLTVWDEAKSSAELATVDGAPDEGIWAVAGALAGPLESRMNRAEWKRVLTRESVAEDVTAETARRMIEIDGPDPDQITGVDQPGVVEVPLNEEDS